MTPDEAYEEALCRSEKDGLTVHSINLTRATSTGSTQWQEQNSVISQRESRIDIRPDNLLLKLQGGFKEDTSMYYYADCAPSREASFAIGSVSFLLSFLAAASDQAPVQPTGRSIVPVKSLSGLLRISYRTF